jgi:NADH dehydrogenase (ubiquinone) 1 alpha subcomplex subunit 9
MSRRIFTRNNNGELSNNWKHTGAEATAMNVTMAVFGCTGFVGRYIAGAGAFHRYTQICPYRHRSGVNGSVRPVRHLCDGTQGQMFPTDYEMDKEFVVKAILEKVENVFNVCGMWQEPAKYEHSNSWFDTEAVNVEWPRLLARWSRELGINRFVHVSMAGADVNSPSKILRQKALAEQAVLEEFPRATIIRGTDCFSEDDFSYTRYLKAQRYWKITPVPNEGKRIHQPLFVGDLAEAAVRAIRIDHTEGRIAELGGPVRFTTNDLLRWCAEVNSLYHYTVGLPKWVWKPMVYVNERSFFRKGSIIGPRTPHWNRDWLERQYIDNVAMPERNPEMLDWEDFGICRDDLFRLEEKFFLVSSMYATENSYTEHGRWL